MNNTKQKIDCHKGNTRIYTEPNGGSLFIGGWNNGATFNWNTHVIDLTGNEHRLWDVPVPYDDDSKKFMPFLMQAYAGWLSLPFPDYGTPKGMSTKQQWIGISNVIKDILKSNKDVLVACHGGHGRSGLFCSIVGYLLHNGKKEWSSPVENIRKIHCDEAVETYAQEKFVYDILGLNITITRQFNSDPYFNSRGTTTFSSTSTFKKCPICGTESLFTEQWGMCLTCKNEYSTKAPVVSDLTLEDINNGGRIKHGCESEGCLGIWTAEKCGHTVHNQIVYEGLCEGCYKNMEEDAAYAEKIDDNDLYGECAMCAKETAYGKKYGICYECADQLTKNELVDFVHNSITDPYKAIAHKCEAESMCVGIIAGDVCGHVVHNREIEDGLCPDCLDRRTNEIRD